MVIAPRTDSFDEVSLDLRSEGLLRRERRAVVLERVGRRAGLMTPLYVSAEDEVFHVRSGEVTLFVGDEAVRAGAGTVVAAPAGVPRALRVESPVTRWLVQTTVASAARYDDFGRALAPGNGEWATPTDEATISAIAAANGIDVLGAPGALPAAA